MQDRFDVVVIGAGAAGIAALRALLTAGADAAALEARGRVGGRALTCVTGGLPLDHGCGWLHSADANPLARLFEATGFVIDRTPPHWERQAGGQDFPPEEQRAFRRAMAALQARLEAAAESGVDRAGAELMEPGGRWNPLIDAVSSYYNGAEYDRVSVLDYAAYEDSGVNWRVADGYGAALAAFAPMDRIVLDCEALRIDRGGRELGIETSRGRLSARAVVVTVPSLALAEGRLAGLREKAAPAEGLPLGLADKVFLGLDGAEDFPLNGHLFGRTDRAETGSYHLRPFGRPYVEAYVGGRCAEALEAEGPGALSRFAIEELAGLLGSDVRRRLRPLAETAWRTDPFSRGAYSHALPGRSACRAELAAPLEARIFFAGEATSAHAFSTAHGAWRTGERAAAEALARLGLTPPARSSG
jgi:monoamine oxidase